MTTNPANQTNPADADLPDPVEVLASLRIAKATPRVKVPGTWVEGTIAGCQFEALVFPEPALNPDYEIPGSRISKLYLADRDRTLAHFERGWDTRPATPAAAQIVDLLAAGLAESVFGR